MTMELKRPACKDCKFYEDKKCKRFPPTLDPNSIYCFSYFPVVEEYDWCGEFQSLPDSESFVGWVLCTPKKKKKKKNE
jgi:hypothetical protein